MTGLSADSSSKCTLYVENPHRVKQDEATYGCKKILLLRLHSSLGWLCCQSACSVGLSQRESLTEGKFFHWKEGNQCWKTERHSKTTARWRRNHLAVIFRMLSERTTMWKTVMSKSKRKRLLMRKRRENIGTFPMTPYKPRWGEVVGAKRARPTKWRPPPARPVLMVHPNDETVSSGFTQKVVANRNYPMNVKLALRRCDKSFVGVC